MNAINKIMIVSMLCTSTILAYADTPAPTSTPDISGTYNCLGSDPFSTPPSFKETIKIAKNGDVYNVQMIHSDSVLPYDFGTGFISKDMPNVFSYVYWDPKNTSTMGTEVLLINSDGSLKGAYADHNKTKSGTESCTKASS